MTRACLGCKAARRKCSGESPCEYCVKRGVECVFDEGKAVKRGPKAGAKAALLSAENERLRKELERLRELSLRGSTAGALSSSQPQQPPAYPALVAQPAGADDDGRGTAALFPQTVWTVDAPIQPTELELATLRTYFDFTNQILPCVDEELFYASLDEARYVGQDVGQEGALRSSGGARPAGMNSPTVSSTISDPGGVASGGKSNSISGGSDEHGEDLSVHEEEDEEEEEEEDGDEEDEEDEDDEDYLEGGGRSSRKRGGSRAKKHRGTVAGSSASGSVLGKRRGGSDDAFVSSSSSSAAAPSAQPRLHPIVSVARNSELFGFRVLYYTLLCIGSKVAGRMADARRYYELARAFIGPVFSTPSQHLVSALLLMVMITRALCQDDNQASLHAALALRMSEVCDVTPEIRMVAVLFAHAHSSEVASWPPPRSSITLLPTGPAAVAVAVASSSSAPSKVASAPVGGGGGKPIEMHIRFSDVLGFIVSQVMLEFPALREGGDAGGSGGDVTASPVAEDRALKFAELLDEAAELQQATGLLKVFPVNVLATGVRALLLLRSMADMTSAAASESALAGQLTPVSPSLAQLCGTSPPSKGSSSTGVSDGALSSSSSANEPLQLISVEGVKRQALKLAVTAIDNARSNPYSRFCFPCVLLQGKLIAATMPLAGRVHGAMPCGSALSGGSAAPASTEASSDAVLPAAAASAGATDGGSSAGSAGTRSRSGSSSNSSDIPDSVVALARTYLQRAFMYIREAKGGQMLCQSTVASPASAAGATGSSGAEGAEKAKEGSCSGFPAVINKPLIGPIVSSEAVMGASSEEGACDGSSGGGGVGDCGGQPCWPELVGKQQLPLEAGRDACPLTAATDATPLTSAPVAHDVHVGVCPTAHVADAVEAHRRATGRDISGVMATASQSVRASSSDHGVGDLVTIVITCWPRQGRFSTAAEE